MISRFLMFVALLSLLAAACTGAFSPAYDLSTDEGVLQAYKQARGGDFVADDFCVARPAALQDIVLVGFFAYDAGCLYDEMFVDGELGGIQEMTTAGLEHNGWSDESRREELALIWANDVIFVEASVLRHSDDEFDSSGKPFSEPMATLNDDGSVTVELWVAYSGGMLPETTYKLFQLEFLAGGARGATSVMDEFTIEYGG